jgi:acetoin utilization deacetylase AcuC-like enzyme
LIVYFLNRVHDFEYLSHLEKKCQSKHDRKEEEFPFFYAIDGKLDCDTPLVDQSFTAAKRFCAAAMHAVDLLLENQKINNQTNPNRSRAFVVGRPPGHHSGPSGCVPSPYFWKRPDMASSGFCLLNTVAVAAVRERRIFFCFLVLCFFVLN